MNKSHFKKPPDTYLRTRSLTLIEESKKWELNLDLKHHTPSTHFLVINKITFWKRLYTKKLTLISHQKVNLLWSRAINECWTLILRLSYNQQTLFRIQLNLIMKTITHFAHTKNLISNGNKQERRVESWFENHHTTSKQFL